MKRIERLDNKRKFFENSIDHAIVWCEVPKEDGAPWGAIGFQEMNTPEKLPKYFDYEEEKVFENRGINYTIDRFKKKLGDNVRAVSGAVNFNGSFPTVLTMEYRGIW